MTNMKAKRKSQSAFTMIEVVAATMILTLTLAGAIAGWLYIVRGERVNSVQNELDIDVRKAIERIRADLRLSSRDHIVYHPPGSNVYTGLSFPLARDDDGDGVIELDPSTGKIIWDQTLVYHVWSSELQEPTTPEQLRQTIFDPRDNSLTPVQRQQQLDSCVEYGNGASTYNGGASKTRVIFDNVFVWSISPKGSEFDGYAPVLSRDPSVLFGSIFLSAGLHNFKFTVIGKNDSSTGYKIGLDDLVVSPCGVPREAERQLPATAQSGATAVGEYMPSGMWRGNYHLSFPAGNAGHSFTLSMSNDRWEESNFDAPGRILDDVIVEFNTALTPKQFEVMPTPPTNAWQADWQTLDIYGDSTGNDALKGAAVRVLIRGSEMVEGGAIKYDGPLHCVWLYAPGGKVLRIMSARIAEATNSLYYCMDAVNSGVQLWFGGSAGVDIPAGSYARGEVAATDQFWIDREKSYLVSFLVDSVPPKCDARFWKELHVGTLSNPPPPGCYVIPGDYLPTVAKLSETLWSDDYDLGKVCITDRLFAVEHLHILATSNGTFTSQIVDTHITAPSYQSIDWHADKPSGTQIKMKVRTGNQPDMSDAVSWSNLTAMVSPGSVNPGAQRYVQFQAGLQASSDGWYVPRLRDVTLIWQGEGRLIDIGGSLTKGPDYGTFEITVDDKPLVKGITIDLTIFEDVRSYNGGETRLTSAMSAEVEPRNTGK